jgi:hypothetical protein
LQLEHMLAARRVATVQILAECDWVDAQLTGERDHDLWVSLLADAQHPTGKPGIAELYGKTELGGGARISSSSVSDKV